MKRSTKVRGQRACERHSLQDHRWAANKDHTEGSPRLVGCESGDASAMPWSFQDSSAAGWRFQDLDTGGLVMAGGRRNTNGFVYHGTQHRAGHTRTAHGGPGWRPAGRGGAGGLESDEARHSSCLLEEESRSQRLAAVHDWDDGMSQLREEKA